MKIIKFLNRILDNVTELHLLKMILDYDYIDEINYKESSSLHKKLK